mmetsp:Transcript_29766/g.88109  ORF Transcript_29766/g.88109 Transcript_29766/m.88109 type:complete len:213 (-) Transcript_29766:2582-3220(-)
MNTARRLQQQTCNATTCPVTLEMLQQMASLRGTAAWPAPGMHRWQLLHTRLRPCGSPSCRVSPRPSATCLRARPEPCQALWSPARLCTAGPHRSVANRPNCAARSRGLRSGARPGRARAARCCRSQQSTRTRRVRWRAASPAPLPRCCTCSRLRGRRGQSAARATCSRCATCSAAGKARVRRSAPATPPTRCGWRAATAATLTRTQRCCATW